jgi:hypothetical protein
MRSSGPPLVLALAVVAIVAACGGGSAPSASGPAATASVTPVVTAEAAVAAVVAHEPRFAGIMPRDADLIGQSSWYEVMAASGVGAFLVELRIGWGDCPAGCIDEHTWTYAVAPNGGVTLQSERGPAVPADAWPSPGTGGVFGTGLLITAVAGPVCPVETIPAKPECAPRPVAGAIVHVSDAQGAEVATATTDATGTAFVAVQPGTYTVVADRVDGLMGEPPAQDAVVTDGTTTPVALMYDTGIR